jgi:hypothetical protein
MIESLCWRASARVRCGIFPLQAASSWGIIPPTPLDRYVKHVYGVGIQPVYPKETTMRYAIYEIAAHGRGDPVSIHEDIEAAHHAYTNLQRDGFDVEILPYGAHAGEINPDNIEITFPEA